MAAPNEHLEYTLVGDTVNLAQRQQLWSEAGQTSLSEGTWQALEERPTAPDGTDTTMESTR